MLQVFTYNLGRLDCDDEVAGPVPIIAMSSNASQLLDPHGSAARGYPLPLAVAGKEFLSRPICIVPHYIRARYPLTACLLVDLGLP